MTTKTATKPTEARPEEQDTASLTRWLTRQVEGLSNNPPAYSRTAYTPRRTRHVIFVDGALKEEGCGCSPAELVEIQFTAIKAYRQTIPGPVDVVWRIGPEIAYPNGRARIYTRLCFEPSLTQVAKGVWVAEGLTEGDVHA